VKPVSVGLLGLGTVGCGTLNVLARNADEIRRRAGRSIEVRRAVARDLKRRRAADLGGIALSDNPDDVVNDAGIDVVVELFGGLDPAHGLILRAIENGKHIVTANKALIADYGQEIFEAAQRRGVMVAFEAAVAGGIPIVKAVREGLSGNRIDRLVGIINGTTNFILTQIRDKQRSFADALTEAQLLGYAEADPSFDVNGIDAAHKLTIIAATAFGIPLQFGNVHIEGLADMDSRDVLYAGELNCRIKHLAIAKRAGGGIELRVHPTLIRGDSMLANVEGVMNAVMVDGDAAGPTLYYGAGAGAEPTASAVVADLIDVVRALTSDPENRVPHLAFQPGALSDVPVLDIGDVVTAYYLRLQVKDEPGVLAAITRVLGDLNISIEAVMQKETSGDGKPVPLVLMTYPVRERDMNEAVDRIRALDSVDDEVVRIRVEPLHGEARSEGA